MYGPISSHPEPLSYHDLCTNSELNSLRPLLPHRGLCDALNPDTTRFPAVETGSDTVSHGDRIMDSSVNLMRGTH